MKKQKKRTDLSVRELTIEDAYAYFKIARGGFLDKFVNFFTANSIDEAKARINAYTSQYEKLYGLFNKNKLVAVFDVSQDTGADSTFDGAVLHCFVGEQYHGMGFAYQGINLLAQLLSNVYSYFIFEIALDNSSCLSMVKKLQPEYICQTKNYKHFKYHF